MKKIIKYIILSLLAVTLFGCSKTTTLPKLTAKPTLAPTTTEKPTTTEAPTTTATPTTTVVTTTKEPAVEMTIEEARNASKGRMVKVTGVVSKITYANGRKPNGFMLIDNTSSIYVFGDLAANLQVGQKVTIQGEKTYYILETEASAAASFNYNGSCQIQYPELVGDVISSDNAIDYSWTETITMKELMETSASENITSLVYKTTALIKKSDGDGTYVNYYIDDLDGKSGSYVYTMCNGSDFNYLDEYNGKICTLYVTALNAKCNASGALFRLLPLDIIESDVEISSSYIPELGAKYYGLPQFETKYIADPAMEVLTSVDNEVLNATGITLEYTSSNTDVIEFTTEESKLVFHTKDPGKATITITAKYLTETPYQATLEIEVVDPAVMDAMTIKEAIDAFKGEETEVTVKGICGPSLVNQDGIYLIDETGMIAIKMTKEELKTISLGDEIIVKGNRVQYNTVKSEENGEKVYYTDDNGNQLNGQTAIIDCTILQNNYGKHDWKSLLKPITTLSVKEMAEQSLAEDHTTECYIVKGQLKREGTNPAYPQYRLIYTASDGTEQYISFYQSSITQYEWLLDSYVGKEVELCMTLCNWNHKKYHTGCVLYVINGETITVNTHNYSTK